MAAMRIFCLTAVLGLQAACTTPQTAYVVFQSTQRQACLKLPDLAERARCEKAADLPYARYKAETEAAKSPQ